MALELHGVKRLAEKVRRQALRAAGKPDNSPWALRPKRPRARPALVDFVFCLDYLSPNSQLLKLFHESMSPYGLSTLLVNSKNVERVTRQVKSGALRPIVYLDLSSRPDDPYEQLLYAAHAAGARAIRNPEHTPWVLKSVSHPIYAQMGLPLPPTVMFAKGEPDRPLTDAEREALGLRCVIKPSFGEAGKGVRLNREPSLEQIKAARDFNRDDDWLVQKMMTWTRYGGRPAYIRAYNVLGHRTMLWWSAERGGYEELTWSDLHEFDLLGAVEIIDRLAAITRMDYFSTEICMTADEGPGRFCMIDYCNDQCDIDPEGSASGSVPIEWTRWVVNRFAEFTWRLKHGLDPTPQKTLFVLGQRA